MKLNKKTKEIIKYLGNYVGTCTISAFAGIGIFWLMVGSLGQTSDAEMTLKAIQGVNAILISITFSTSWIALAIYEQVLKK